MTELYQPPLDVYRKIRGALTVQPGKTYSPTVSSDDLFKLGVRADIVAALNNLVKWGDLTRTRGAIRADGTRIYKYYMPGWFPIEGDKELRREKAARLVD